jgi:hypothetical protein
MWSGFGRGHVGRATAVAPVSHRPSSPACCSRMHVPSDSFNGRSPERHAAMMLENMFTFCACKIALAQMQGDGRGDLGSFGGEQHTTLKNFMAEHPLGSGSVNSKEWLERLLQVDRDLALRIIECRYAYAKEDFEWEQLKRIAVDGMDAANVGILRQMLEKEFGDDA